MQVMMASRSVSGLRGELKYTEPMSAHTSWRVGGPADRCYRPADLDDLKNFLADLCHACAEQTDTKSRSQIVVEEYVDRVRREHKKKKHEGKPRYSRMLEYP